MRRNVAGQHVNVTLLAADGSIVDTGTTSVFVTGDNGTRTAGGGTVTNKTGGDWDYGPTQAETDYAHIKFTFTNPGAVNVGANIYTNESADQTGDAYDVANTRLPAALSSNGNILADVRELNNVPGSSANLSAGASELITFTVGASPTATSIPTDITGAPYTTVNHFEGRVVTINGETRKIVGSGGSPVVLTTTDFNHTVAQNDTGVIS